MTDKSSTQASKAGPIDDSQDNDSLQQRAKRETPEAVGDGPGEDREQPPTTPPIANPD